MWIPAIIDQLTAEHGNLEAIRQYFGHPESALGLVDGAGLLAGEFRFLPPWLGGTTSYRFGDSSVVPASLGVAARARGVGGGRLVGRRRSGRRSDQRLVALAVLMVMVAVVTLSRISIAPVAFLFFWRIAVAVFLVFACSVALVHAFPETSRRVRVPALVVLAAGSWSSSAIAVADVVERRDVFGPNERQFAALLRQVRHDGLPRGPRARTRGRRSELGFRPGTGRRTRRRGGAGEGRRASSDTSSARSAARRVADVDEVWLVTEGGEARERMRAPDPVHGSSRRRRRCRHCEERELTSLQRKAATAFQRAGQTGTAEYLDNEYFGDHPR